MSPEFLCLSLPLSLCLSPCPSSRVSLLLPLPHTPLIPPTTALSHSLCSSAPIVLPFCLSLPVSVSQSLYFSVCLFLPLLLLWVFPLLSVPLSLCLPICLSLPLCPYLCLFVPVSVSLCPLFLFLFLSLSSPSLEASRLVAGNRWLSGLGQRHMSSQAPPPVAAFQPPPGECKLSCHQQVPVITVLQGLAQPPAQPASGNPVREGKLPAPACSIATPGARGPTSRKGQGEEESLAPVGLSQLQHWELGVLCGHRPALTSLTERYG